ncbi:MAG TPA: hypothetical protein VN253_14935 [Kofleriaceae bacterium]|nr:hypothetical protein [Kofleriaceae bacterium]
MQGSSRHRRRLALATCVLWLLGLEVLPNLHLAAHRHDHTHAADGAIVWSHDEDHDHDAAHDHDHDAAHDHDADAAGDDGQVAIDHRPADRHHAGGIAHHAAALHRPAPPLLAPLEVERAAWRICARAEGRPYSTGTSRPTARGPPSV